MGSFAAANWDKDCKLDCTFFRPNICVHLNMNGRNDMIGARSQSSFLKNLRDDPNNLHNGHTDM